MELKKYIYFIIISVGFSDNCQNSVFQCNDYNSCFYFTLTTTEYVRACVVLCPAIASYTTQVRPFFLLKNKIHLGISVQCIEVREIGENEEEESHQNTSQERKENTACIKKERRAVKQRCRLGARRQTGDGWMDVGFFDVNARGNTSSIMATTAVVNFYILRATSPIPRNPILQPFYTQQSSPLNLGGCPPKW